MSLALLARTSSSSSAALRTASSLRTSPILARTHFYSLSLSLSLAVPPSSMPSPSPSPSSSQLRQRVPTASSARSHSGHSHSGHSHSHGGGGGHGHSHGGIEETAFLSDAVTSLRRPSSLDPGSRITLIGLVANVGLTALKGVAGYVLASSALLADAAHSGSDLVADVVTLVSYRIGRWEPSGRYPYGYGKFESLGSLVVSFLLFATAAGIGLHSYHHLLLSLSTIPSIPADLLASLDFLPHGHSHGPELASPTTPAHSHGHEHSTLASEAAAAAGAGAEGLVDARAMYFALASILVKEWLYRSTLRVAKSTHSNVLLANAYHHRSDALGSLVALIAIGAARVGYPMLDPVGGLVVTGMIAKQGWDVGREALGGLVDRVGDAEVEGEVRGAVEDVRDGAVIAAAGKAGEGEGEGATGKAQDPAPAPVPILGVPQIRLFASGPSLLIDILLVLPPSLSLAEANRIEALVGERVRERIGGGRVREVVVRMRAGEEEDGEGEGKEGEGR
ncbi:hypothetical protein JCM6882_007638 [Rhodosporidiobolus microsporus]